MNTYDQNRYARQRQFAPIGDSGQRRIESSVVAILGCGALGTVAAELLCRSGVGKIRIIDRDIVEWTNLQRQSLFDCADAQQGECKAEAACRRLEQINDLVQLSPYVVDVQPSNIEALLDGVDLVIDATDNFAVRFLLNDWALATKTAWVHGGCVGAGGQVRLFDGAGSPCFRCLVPSIPPAHVVDTCDTAGVLAPATHAIASFQAAEALKWLSGNRQAVSKEVISMDFWHHRHRAIRLDSSLAPSCVACVQRQFEFLRGDRMLMPDAALCGRNAVQIQPTSDKNVDLTIVERRWQGLGNVQRSRFLVRLTIDDGASVTLFRDGRMLIQGTDDISRARSIADRYVGG